MSQGESAGSADKFGDLSAKEFRTRLHEVADWIADYREKIEAYPVSPNLSPGTLQSSLPSSAPENPDPIGEILQDVDRLIIPGIVHWGHPAFLGYFGSTTTGPGILAEMMTAALNVSAMTWRTSPAATELEFVVLEWLRQMLGLPPSFFGVVYDTASVATLHALAAARGHAARARGLFGESNSRPVRIYASEQAHSSIEKAAIMLGIGEENVVRVACDYQYCMDPNALDSSIGNDVEQGYRPMAVVATVGTTSTTSVDPVPKIAAICRKNRLWLHVDAAYGGAMALLPEGHWVMDGTEHADSIVVNPHKWLFVPLDFSSLFVRNAEVLRSVFSLTPEYLRGDAETGETNYMDYGIQLGRRFRALKAWMVFRAFGRKGIADRIREHIRLATAVASWIDADPDFEVLAPVLMGVVCFRARPSILREHKDGPTDLNKLNEEIVKAVNASGKVYLTHTQLREGVSMRLAIGIILTTEAHLKQAWQVIREEAARQQAEIRNRIKARQANHQLRQTR